ncbi:ABC transporter permease [Homoserinimonas sp. OAct 916]|uniref:ABC transporter permease n=1 Tax=Homoserinimonas sp. OAct 916 TaxID=2211450 RepID=UPI000DBE0F7D|nr:ABC transporter permease [Homoserinimonas sp. OAct 916]
MSDNKIANSTIAVAKQMGKRVRIDAAAWIVLGVDFAVIVAFGAASDWRFLRTENLQALAVNSSQIVLLATAVALILALGEIDISLGAVLVASSVASGQVLSVLQVDSTFLILSIGLISAVIVGSICLAVNAGVLLILKVNSFIGSLATLGIFTGTVYVITNGSNITGVPITVQDAFGSYRLFGFLPAPALVAVIVALGAWYVIRRTRLGVHMIAAGSNRDASIRAGVKTQRIVLITFLIAGVIVGLAGFIDLSRFGTTDIAGHQTDALSAIAGAVIGGTRLNGGKVSILGAISGALLASILQTGLIVVGLPSFYQLIAIGIVLIAAVAIGQRRKDVRN